jgi:hypothetical protein
MSNSRRIALVASTLSILMATWFVVGPSSSWNEPDMAPIPTSTRLQPTRPLPSQPKENDTSGSAERPLAPSQPKIAKSIVDGKNDDMNSVQPETNQHPKGVESGTGNPLSSHARHRQLGRAFPGLCRKHCPNPEGGRPPSFCQEGWKEPSWTLAYKQPSGGPFPVSTLAVEDVSDDPPAVFVAMGPMFFGGCQDYVFKSIKQWRRFHPTSPVYLIVSDAMASHETIVRMSKEINFEIASESEVETPESIRYKKVFYIQGYMHPCGSRTTGNKDFNRLVSQRFYAVYGLMKLKNLGNVIHLEGDNMIYGNYRPVVDAARRCGHGMATLAAKTDAMIPGVVYIKDTSSVLLLLNFINELLSCGIGFGKAVKKGYANDMTYLMNFFEYYGSSAMGILPCWEHAAGENCIAEVLGREKVLFDAASFGQWYSFSAKDNRTYPATHIRNAMKGRFLDATPGPRLEWIKDEEGRRVPTWKGYRLLNLHIHAKNLEVFAS